MKYDLNFKLDCVRKYKEGKRDFVPSGICRRTFLSHVGSWANLVNFCYLNLDNYICHRLTPMYENCLSSPNDIMSCFDDFASPRN